MESTSKRESIPLLPHGAVAFPEEISTLKIADPRFKQLLHEAEENDLVFGVAPVVRKRLFAYGTLVRLQKIVSREKNGAVVVELMGTRIFRLRNFVEQYSQKVNYPAGEVTFPKEIDKLPSMFLQKLSERVFLQINRLFSEKMGDLFQQQTETRNHKNEDLSSFYMINRLVGLDLEEKAIFLAMRSEEKRFTLLYDQMKRLHEVMKVVLN